MSPTRARAQRVGGPAHGREVRARARRTARRCRPRRAPCRRRRGRGCARSRAWRSASLRAAMRATCGVGSDSIPPGDQPSSRASPAASRCRSSGVRSAGSIQRTLPSRETPSASSPSATRVAAAAACRPARGFRPSPLERRRRRGAARLDKLAGRWQALDQRAAGALGGALEVGEVRPGRLGVDVVGRHRRDAAPVVDAGADQLRQALGLQVGRRLDVHGRPEDQARHGDGPDLLLERGLGAPRPCACRAWRGSSG